MTNLRELVSASINNVKSYAAYRSIIKANWPQLDIELSSKPYNRYAENLYLFLNNLQCRPTCNGCGKELVYIDRTSGYGTFCSTKCSANSLSVKEKHKLANDRKTIDDKHCIVLKRKSTMMKKYGVEHALQDSSILAASLAKYKQLDQPTIQRKRQNTIKQKYNVDNIWDLPDFITKIKETNLKRYNSEWALQNYDVKNKSKITNIQTFYNNLSTRVENAIPLFTVDEFINVSTKYKWKCKCCSTEFMDNIDDGFDPQCPTCFPTGKNTSKGEIELVNYIKNELMISNIIQNTTNIISPKEIDIWLPDYNLAIEFNGLYWHSEKKISNKLYHQRKFLECEKLGIRLIQIFSDEWQFTPDIVKNRIKHLLKLSTKICYARQCTIQVISKLQHDQFIKLYHIQGTCRSKIRLGAFYNGTLVAVMSFGKSRAIYNSAGWELLRFAVIGSIPGIASKMFKRFVNDNNPDNIVSYCDIRWGTGKVYTELNMTHCGITTPGYWYTKDGIHRTHRYSMYKHKLEIIKDLGFYRIWDAGHRKFIWTI